MKYWQKDNDATTAVMKFYGNISQWGNNAKDFTDILCEIEKRFKNLEIKLHCYGGEVFEGNVMFNALAASELKIIWCIEGVAASMGGILPLANGKVVMCENALWMIHKPSSCTVGGDDEHFATGKVLKAIKNNFIKAYQRKTKKSTDVIAAWFDGADNWFDAEECKSLGLADEICVPVEEAVEAEKPNDGTDVESVYNRYTALANPTNSHTKIKKMDKKSLIAKLGLTGVTEASSDTAIEDAIVAQISAKDSTITSLKTASKTAIKAQATGLIEARQKELNTTFTVEQKAGFETIADASGIEVLKTVLTAMVGVPDVKSIIENNRSSEQQQQGANDRTKWNYDEWEKNDEKGLEALAKSTKAEDKAMFKALYIGKFGAEAEADFK